MFSYSLDLVSLVHRVRFHINDVNEGAGPMPDDVNFTDEEIEAVLSVEGSWQRAVASCLERLATAWRLYPSFNADQFEISRSHIARGFADDAARWREQYGYNGKPVGFSSSSPIRNDAYSTGLTVSGE